MGIDEQVFKLITDRHLTERRSTAEIREEVGHHRKIGEAQVHHPHVVPQRRNDGEGERHE